METISFYDYQESFYHGFLAGLLRRFENHITKSNRESGAGRPDIVLIPCDLNDTVIIIEIKLAAKIDGLGAACEDALRQIEERQYDADARAEGYTRFIHYGIAFYKKIAAVRCRRIDF